MKSTVTRVLFLLCLSLLIGCGDDDSDPVAPLVTTEWSIAYKQIGHGWINTVTSTALAGFRDTYFRIESDTVWTDSDGTAPTNMKIIVEATHAHDSTYSGSLRIIERAYGTDGSRSIALTFSADRKSFVTEVVEIRGEGNELLASFLVQGVEK